MSGMSPVLVRDMSPAIKAPASSPSPRLLATRLIKEDEVEDETRKVTGDLGEKLQIQDQDYVPAGGGQGMECKGESTTGEAPKPDFARVRLVCTPAKGRAMIIQELARMLERNTASIVRIANVE